MNILEHMHLQLKLLLYACLQRTKISPGDMWKLTLGATDQSGNWRETLWGMEYDDSSEVYRIIKFYIL